MPKPLDDDATTPDNPMLTAIFFKIAERLGNLCNKRHKEEKDERKIELLTHIAGCIVSHLKNEDLGEFSKDYLTILQTHGDTVVLYMNKGETRKILEEISILTGVDKDEQNPLCELAEKTGKHLKASKETLEDKYTRIGEDKKTGRSLDAILARPNWPRIEMSNHAAHYAPEQAMAVGKDSKSKHKLRGG